MNLVFEERFDGDLSLWNKVHYGTHSAYLRPENVTTSNGKLIQTAKREDYQGYQYTGAEISTRNKFEFLYGYVEARIKIPIGQGLWPAVWTLANQWPPEIDIFEALCHETDKAYFCHHWGTVANHHSVCGELIGYEFADGFHTVGMLWQEDSITWYVDGIERYKATNDIPNVPLHLLISFYIGGGWAGEPDASTLFPSYFEVDYIRVYQGKGPMTVLTDLQAIETSLRQQALDLIAQADAVAQTIVALQAMDDQLDSAADVIDTG